MSEKYFCIEYQSNFSCDQSYGFMLHSELQPKRETSRLAWAMTIKIRRGREIASNSGGQKQNPFVIIGVNLGLARAGRLSGKTGSMRAFKR